MNKIDKNAICVVSLVEGFMKVVCDNGSKSVTKLATTVMKKSDKVVVLHPRPTTKEVNQLARRIKRFESEVLHAQPHVAIVLTSCLLAMIADVVGTLSEEKHRAWQAMEQSLFTLHKYYDRKLNNYTYYKKADAMAYRWENYV